LPTTNPKRGFTRLARMFGGSLLGLSLCAGLLVAVSAAPSGAGAATAPITLYSGQHVQTTQALVNAFEKKTGIDVKVRFDDEDVLADQLATEGTHSPADVFFTENSPPLQFLASKHLLDPVKPSTLALTPSKYESPNGMWAGVSARVSVMVYNTSLLKQSQLPTSAMQLAKPKWNGKIALAGGETDFQPIVTSVARTYGSAAALRWLEAIKANAGSHQYPDNETVVDEVNRGQVALGVINQYYWYRMRAQEGSPNVHSAIAYFAPRDVGYVIDVSGAAVLRSSQHAAEAQRFVAFLDSKQGQQIISHSDSFEYPIASGVTTAQPETPFSWLRPNGITVAQLGTGALAVKLLQEAQLL
jgi:iron(III) transport system substrate-binding protein